MLFIMMCFWPLRQEHWHRCHAEQLGAFPPEYRVMADESTVVKRRMLKRRYGATVLAEPYWLYCSALNTVLAEPYRLYCSALQCTG